MEEKLNIALVGNELVVREEINIYDLHKLISGLGIMRNMTPNSFILNEDIKISDESLAYINLKHTIKENGYTYVYIGTFNDRTWGLQFMGGDDFRDFNFFIKYNGLWHFIENPSRMQTMFYGETVEEIVAYNKRNKTLKECLSSSILKGTIFLPLS